MKGDLDAAERVLDAADAALPDSVRLLTERGLLAYDRTDYDLAIAAFDRALAADPRSETAWEWKATALRMKRDLDAAERVLDAADAALPDSVRLLNERGLLAYARNDYDLAIAAFDRALAADPRSETAWEWKATALRMKNCFDAARQVIDEGLRSVSASERHLLMSCRALLELEDNRSDEAVRTLEEYTEAAREGGQDEADTWWWVGNVLDDARRLDAALGAWARAVAADPEHVYAQHNIANLLWNEGAFREGKEAWDRTRKLHESKEQTAIKTRNADHFAYFGSTLMDVYGELEGAERCLERSVSLDPGNLDSLGSLLTLRREQGRRYVAEEGELHRAALTRRLRETFAGQQPDEGSRTEPFVHPYWQAGELAKRLEALLTGPSSPTMKDRASVELADLYLEIEDNDKARVAYVAALAATRNIALEARIHKALGVLDAREGQFASAVAHSQESLARVATDLGTRLNLAEAQLKGDELLAAEVEYKRIIQQAPRHVEAHIGLGEVYTAMAEAEADADLFALADQYYTKALAMADSGFASKQLKRTDRAAVLYSRGYARTAFWESSGPLAGSQSLRRAKADFTKCLKCDRNHFKASRALVRIDRRLRAGFKKMSLLPDGEAVGIRRHYGRGCLWAADRGSYRTSCGSCSSRSFRRASAAFATPEGAACPIGTACRGSSTCCTPASPGTTCRLSWASARG